MIAKLASLLEENGDKEIIMNYENVVIDSIDEFCKEDTFYELPTNEILKIIGKSNIENIELLCEIITKMNESKGDDSILLMNVIDPKNATFEDCINVISKFRCSPICRRTYKLSMENMKFPDRDYDYEMGKLKKEINALSKKPTDFESNICKAANEGKLSSVKYLVEECNADIGIIDEYGSTPLRLAAREGHLDVVKYLCENCHANVETCGTTKNMTPVNDAAFSGHMDVVKYLVEICHAKITQMTIEYTDDEEIKKYLVSKM